MCLHFAPFRDAQWFMAHLHISLPTQIPVEVYPGYLAPLIRKTERRGAYQCQAARFGLIPSWSQSKNAYHHSYTVRGETMTQNHSANPSRGPYNARSETVGTKPSFRTAWNRCHFGLVLVSHFYQPKYENGMASSWAIARSNQEPIALACLWDRWSDIDAGRDIVSFCFLTQSADEHPLLRQFHREGDEKRSPVIIPTELMGHWLDADSKTASQMLESPPPMDLVGKKRTAETQSQQQIARKPIRKSAAKSTSLTQH